MQHRHGNQLVSFSLLHFPNCRHSQFLSIATGTFTFASTFEKLTGKQRRHNVTLQLFKKFNLAMQITLTRLVAVFSCLLIVRRL